MAQIGGEFGEQEREQLAATKEEGAWPPRMLGRKQLGMQQAAGVPRSAAVNSSSSKGFFFNNVSAFALPLRVKTYQQG